MLLPPLDPLDNKDTESNPPVNPRGSVNQRARELERVGLGLRKQPPGSLSDPEMWASKRRERLAGGPGGKLPQRRGFGRPAPPVRREPAL